MPLHLLGKKSWNVYNTDNVERVRRDEAEAQAREEAAEQRMQAEDAARRIAILRGEEPPPLPAAEPEDEVLSASGGRKRGAEESFGRRRKKRRGEDDTDQAIRYAREDAEAGEKARESQALKGREQERDAPLVDHAGHVQLFAAPDEASIRKAAKNAEAEAEKAKKKKRDEDQYTMRFSHAAGFKKSAQQKPWYAANGAREDGTKAVALSDVQDKDVWGNEDPRRREREQSRVSSNDPFAAMQQAQRQLKRSETDREKWKRERDAEIEELKRAEERQRRREEKRDRRRREVDHRADSLEGFSLDDPVTEKSHNGGTTTSGGGVVLAVVPVTAVTTIAIGGPDMKKSSTVSSTQFHQLSYSHAPYPRKTDHPSQARITITVVGGGGGATGVAARTHVKSHAHPLRRNLSCIIKGEYITALNTVPSWIQNMDTATPTDSSQLVVIESGRVRLA
ncbi:uncharacterized protein LTR77_006013 [Saxophila tyrrhenica]|uniref:CBF1-interacting co-repressor CIR N-terminal domain-containing protein n=1 Tax=Saxophila tyrrhenica TaxID=1690608 RepID=A0AAV9P6P0_9PEZI|nr:hypothetical protein LTR77_006013 [Saxophila tyrrhenica]